MVNPTQQFSLTSDHIGKRVDIVIAELTNLSRSQVRKLIADRKVKLNEKIVTKPGSLINKQHQYIVLDTIPTERNRIIAEDIPLQIIYEDEYILAVNKKPGIVVHPGAGHKDSTLLNALEAYREKHKLPQLRLLHRLDKDTSGILLVSKDEHSFGKFGDLFEKRQLEKIYIALAIGIPKKLKGYIDAPIERSPHDRQKFAVSESSSSRRALTAFQVIDFFGAYSLWTLRIHTGRTHQIRVHLSTIGHPIIGDEAYSSPASLHASLDLGVKRQLLHAYQMTFTHPVTKKKLTITAPLPFDFKQVLGKLSDTKYKLPAFNFADYDYHHQW